MEEEELDDDDDELPEDEEEDGGVVDEVYVFFVRRMGTGPWFKAFHQAVKRRTHVSKGFKMLQI